METLARNGLMRNKNLRSCLDFLNPLSANPNKMFKHTQTIRPLLPTNCLSVFDHFVGMALEGLRML